MANDCAICYEPMEQNHNIVTPTNCKHSFHAICINIWLARHRSCPLCRKPISLTTQMPWRTLFSTALIVTHEMALERASYTYAFLSQILKTYDTSEKWRVSSIAIHAAAQHFEMGLVRLPFLDLTSRTTTKREKYKWRQIFEEISGESVRLSERIAFARRGILMYEVGAPHTSGRAHTT
jgi:hypothetical protein